MRRTEAEIVHMIGKEHKPKSNAVEMATAIGATLLTVDEYRGFQELGQFDTATSSWVQTPTKIRKLGGALFCDRRYDAVFVYHNGAESYYAARGFRWLPQSLVGPPSRTPRVPPTRASTSPSSWM
jgi:hypothetical protein